MTKAAIKDRMSIIYIVIGILIVIALLILSVYKNTDWYIGIFVGGITYICMVIYRMVKASDRAKNIALILIGLAIVCATLIVSFYNNYNILTFYNSLYSSLFSLGIALILLGIYYKMIKSRKKLTNVFLSIVAGLGIVASISLMFFFYKNLYSLSGAILLLIGFVIILTSQITNNYERYRKALGYMIIVILILVALLFELGTLLK